MFVLWPPPQPPQPHQHLKRDIFIFNYFSIRQTALYSGTVGLYLGTVSFSKVVLSQGAVNKVFLGVFLMFLAFFHSKIWAKFHFGTFKPYD